VRYARTIKETQAKPASLIPPEPTTKKTLGRIFGAATPPGALVFRNEKTLASSLSQRANSISENAI
jgi:hypothetical protein